MQVVLCDGMLSKKYTWQTVVLIPKRKGDFRGIGLVKVLWKVVTSLLNRRLTAEISFHNTLYRFRAGRGARTASLEVNLIQQLTSMGEAVLFEVFLDLRKAYDALDRERTLELLAAYRVSPSTVRILWEYWDQLTMVAKSNGYF